MIYLPLEHLDERYTTHLDRDIVEYLGRKGIDYKYIEPKTLTSKIESGSFLDAKSTVYRQFYQMQEVIKLLATGEIAKDETLFVTDIWNFALMCIPYINFFTNSNLKVRGILHAGSFTDTDFVRQMERVYKGFEESLFDICDKVYVASEFIRKDVMQKRYINPDKLVVSGLPLDWKNLKKYNCSQKEDMVIFNGRNVDEKQPYLFDLLQKRLPYYKYINTQKEGYSKDEYYNVLSKAKCVVSFALQENFGYGIQEAVALGCVPVVPNRLAYVEQFDKKYRYDNFDECISMVKDTMNGKFESTTATYPDNDKIFDIWFKD